MFDNFINISSQEQEQRSIFSNYIFEKLHDGDSTLNDKQIKALDESSMRGYRKALEVVFSNESLKLCEGNSELSEAITDNFLEFVTNTQKAIESTGNHFYEEEKMLVDFKTITKPLFEQKWESIKTFIEKEYKPREINIEFYAKEFTESLNSTDTNEELDSENQSFETIKKNFEKKWDKELYQKKIRHELNLIEMSRMEFLKELYENIEKFRKMMGGLIDDENMIGILGRLWGMGKGKWEKVNFDAIRKYSERLKNDTSLAELAEMLGRMQNGETELVDEEFVNTKTRPEWIPEKATKSDLIGIREVMI
jgi:uncharacterized protein with von Willebrand factor type A (vWA) domain